MQTPNFHTTPNWILSHLPFISCALPLPAEWHGNSSHIHALLLAVSTGTVLLHVLLNKAGMQGIMESVRLYPTVGLLLILLSLAIQMPGGILPTGYFSHAWQGMFDNPAGLACFACLWDPHFLYSNAHELYVTGYTRLSSFSLNKCTHKKIQFLCRKQEPIALFMVEWPTSGNQYSFSNTYKLHK